VEKLQLILNKVKILLVPFITQRLVLISTQFLETLSEEEYKSGLGEVTKYAFIGNKKLYKFIQKNAEKIKLEK
jgi:3-dehydroquinate synthetase